MKPHSRTRANSFTVRSLVNSRRPSGRARCGQARCRRGRQGGRVGHVRVTLRAPDSPAPRLPWHGCGTQLAGSNHAAFGTVLARRRRRVMLRRGAPAVVRRAGGTRRRAAVPGERHPRSRRPTGAVGRGGAAHYLRFGGVSPINAANRGPDRGARAELADAASTCRCTGATATGTRCSPDTMRRMADDGVRRAVCFVTSAYSGYSACRQYLEDIAAGPGRRWATARRSWTRSARSSTTPGSSGRSSTRPPRRSSGSTGGRRRPPGLHRPQRAAGRRVVVATTSRRSRRRAGWWPSASRATGPGRSCGRAAAGRRRCRGWSPTSATHLTRLAARGRAGRRDRPDRVRRRPLRGGVGPRRRGARRAARLGLPAARAATPGVHPAFVAMVADLIGERLDPAGPVASLGRLPARPASCPRRVLPPAGPPPLRSPARRPVTGPDHGRTRPSTTVTRSAANRRACSAAWGLTIVPSARTTRHQGTSASPRASRRPTARPAPGRPASAATSP